MLPRNQPLLRELKNTHYTARISRAQWYWQKLKELSRFCIKLFVLMRVSLSYSEKTTNKNSK